jgi:hypothetical protein
MRPFALSIALLVLSVAGCGGDQPAAETPVAYQKPRHTSVEHVAWLSTRLPVETIAYLRLPNPWAVLSVARDDLLHPAQSDAALQAELETLRIGIEAQLQALLPPQSTPLLELVLETSTAPLEAAALSAADGSAMPNLLLGTRFESHDASSLAEWLDEIAAASEQIRVFARLDDQGNGTLMAGPLPVYLHFESTSGRLWMLTGLSASEKMLVDFRAADSGSGLKQVRDHEQRFDSTGQGLAIWIKPKELWPLVVPILDPLQASSLELTGIQEADFIWLGTANRNGNSELRLDLGMGKQGFRAFLPVVDQQSLLTTAGEPSLLVRMAIPSATELQNIIDQALAMSVDGRLVRDQMDELRAQFSQLAGFEVDDLLAAFGPDLLAVNDQAGSWTALRVRDRDAYQRIKDGLAMTTNSQPQVGEVAGLEVHHWHLPGFMQAVAALEENQDQAMDPGLLFFSRLKSHLYWVEEGDYLILASLPQILLERAGSDQPLQLGSWLDRGHDLNWQHAMLAGLANTEDTGQAIYNGYLRVLLALSDLVEVEIDLLALPTADKLGLPSRGRYAFQLDAGPEMMTFSLQYGHSPLDALVGGNVMTATAVMGIVAAIAIPAYNDYMVRSRVAEALSQAAILKLHISEDYLASGGFPDQARAEQIVFSNQVESDAVFTIEAGSGVILMNFSDPQLQDLVLQLSPHDMDDSSVSWRCEVVAGPEQFAPASCR